MFGSFNVKAAINSVPSIEKPMVLVFNIGDLIEKDSTFLVDSNIIAKQKEAEKLAKEALILGVLTYFTFVTGFFAIKKANKALKLMKQYGGSKEAKSNAKLALWLSFVPMILTVIYIAFLAWLFSNLDFGLNLDLSGWQFP
jgi:hypothetical protein